MKTPRNSNVALVVRLIATSPDLPFRLATGFDEARQTAHGQVAALERYDMVAGIDMHGTEIEIKLRIEDPPRLIAAVERAGSRLVRAREFEDNRLYDFPQQDLMRREAMLRVRVVPGSALLTYKDSPRVEEGAKVRHEIEVRFDADGPLVAILERIGMVPQFRYQKYRTTWARGELKITLDETPIGNFTELEGP